MLTAASEIFHHSYVAQAPQSEVFATSSLHFPHLQHIIFIFFWCLSEGEKKTGSDVTSPGRRVEQLFRGRLKTLRWEENVRTFICNGYKQCKMNKTVPYYVIKKGRTCAGRLKSLCVPVYHHLWEFCVWAFPQYKEL